MQRLDERLVGSHFMVSGVLSNLLSNEPDTRLQVSTNQTQLCRKDIHSFMSFSHSQGIVYVIIHAIQYCKKKDLLTQICTSGRSTTDKKSVLWTSLLIFCRNLRLFFRWNHQSHMTCITTRTCLKRCSVAPYWRTSLWEWRAYWTNGPTTRRWNRYRTRSVSVRGTWKSSA